MKSQPSLVASYSTSKNPRRRYDPIYESERVRDLYRYYIPVEFDTTPVPDHFSCLWEDDDNSLDTLERPLHLPISSVDTTLTAFAQLVTLRLNIRRAIISLIDDSNQYIVAEATQTLSLTCDDVHEHADQLIFGSTIIPSHHGVCELTLDSTHSNAEPDQKDIGDVTGLTMLLPLRVYQDADKNPITRERLVIKRHPETKLIVTIPLRTPEGHNIGAITAMGETSRPIDAVQHKFLSDLSYTIVDYLEASRLREDSVLSQAMIKSMGDFVDGDGSVRHTWRTKKRKQKEADSRRRRRRFLRVLSDSGSVNSGSSQGTKSPISELGPPLVEGNEPTTTTKGYHEQSIKEVESRLKSAPQVTNSEDDVPKARHPKHIIDIFTRGSSIMREAMDIEGVVFMDASISSFGGNIRKSRVEPGTGNRRSSSESGSEDNLYDKKRDRTLSNGETDSESGANGLTPELVPAENPKETKWSPDNSPNRVKNLQNILSFATRDGSSLAGDEPSESFANMDEEFLHILLRRYPQGKILYFDQGDTLSSSEDTDELHGDRVPGASKNSKKYSRDELSRMATRVIRHMFPGVRCCILFPLWDSHRERWHAGGFAYTTVPTKMFTLEREFAYTTAFGNCVMAEVARYDAITSDKAKSDFISSISHELRSPLHGILASVEFIHETDLDEYQESLTQTIEGCGRTLLDCINHVLDFSRQPSSKRDPAITRKPGNVDSEYSSIFIDLASTLEEVVNGIYTGFDYKKAKSSNPSTTQVEPILYVDIDQRTNWVFDTEPGAWKRIIMNLVSNALKYTQTGWIRVHLSALDTEDGKVKISLSVSDSGKGIDAEFLKNKLFSPFEQENSISPGSGLGMSLVWTMVQKLGGQITVKSEVGVGSQFLVTIEMSSAPIVEEDTIPSETQEVANQYAKHAISLPELKARLEGKSVSFLGFDDQRCAQSVKGWRESLSNTLSKWFGLIVLPSFDPSANFIMVEELVEPLDMSQFGHEVSLSSNYIVLCCNGTKSDHLRNVLGHTAKIHHVTVPIGPHKLCKAFESMTTQKKHSLSVETSSGPSSPPASSSTQATTPSDNGLEDAFSESGPSISTKPRRMVLRRTSSYSTSSSNPPPKILIVEDNAVNMKLLEMYVARKGLKSHKACNGFEAVETFKREGGFDLIFMDISMPIMNGIEATREIRIVEQNQSLTNPARIIALTALASVSTQQDAFSSGVNLFLTKPVSFKRVGTLCDQWKDIKVIHENGE